MKTLIIIFNILFLSFGNVLISNHHHLEEHSHHEENECVECVTIKNNDNYISNYFSLDVFVFNSNQLQIIDFTTIDIDSNKRYNSRAPPIS